MTSKKLKQRHHFIHDQSLLKSLAISWLAVLIISVAWRKGLEFFPHYTFFLPTFSFLFSRVSHDNIISDPTWKHLETHGEVELMRRPIDAVAMNEYSRFFTTSSSKGLYAHRAVATVNLPLESLIHVFRDTPNETQWAKDLKEVEEYHKSGAHHKEEDHTQVQTSIVRQKYRAPLLGMSDREYLMTKTMTAIENSDGTHSKVTYDFQPLSVSDPADTNFSLCRNCVRGTHLSKWTFTSLDNGTRTEIELDVAVDPNAPQISPFVINAFQKSWPHVSMRRLLTVTRRLAHREGEVPASNARFKLFPLLL